MKCRCQAGDRGKNQAGVEQRGLIIAAETVLFPPLTEEPSSHFYTHRGRGREREAQTDAHWLGTEFEQ